MKKENVVGINYNYLVLEFFEYDGEECYDTEEGIKEFQNNINILYNTEINLRNSSFFSIQSRVLPLLCESVFVDGIDEFKIIDLLGTHTYSKIHLLDVKLIKQFENERDDYIYKSLNDFIERRINKTLKIDETDPILKYPWIEDIIIKFKKFRCELIEINKESICKSYQ